MKITKTPDMFRSSLNSSDASSIDGVVIGLPGATGPGQGIVSSASNVASWQPIVSTITANGSTTLLGPNVNFASGSNITFSVASNTLTIHSSLAFGSNSNSVSSFNSAGASPSNSRADHVHLGVTSISHTSNTFSGPVILTASGGLGITSPTPGTLTLSAPTSGGAGGGSGAPTTAKYIVATADAELSAEIPRPELDDYSISGATVIDFTAPTSDNAALTLAAETDMAQRVTSTEVTTRRHAYVSSAIGTGDFDLRMRIVSLDITSPHTAASNPFCGLFVADSSLTASTRLSVQSANENAAADFNRMYALAVQGTAGVGTGIYGVKFPIIHRIRRVGTTITFFVSLTEGRVWMQLGATITSSLNVGRIGLVMVGGSTGTQTSVALVHWLRSF